MKSIILSCILLFGVALRSNATSISGYTDKASYRYGETIKFYIDGPNANTDLYIYELDGTFVQYVGTTYLASQLITTTNPWTDGFGFSVSYSWPVPFGLKSGYYMLNNSIPFIVKNSSHPGAEDVVIVVPTNTINAYTASGGHSLYDPPYTTVSFMRTMVRGVNASGGYQNCDDGFFTWIRTWSATNSYKIGYISDQDMDDYQEISNAKLLVIPGHSEYWTRQARLNFDQFVDAGKDAIVLSGNTMWWQVRYDNSNPSNPQLVCDRGANWGFADDLTAPDALQQTYHWGEPTLKYSILGSIGAESLHGGYGVDAGSTKPCYGGFNGHKIISPSSPILTGLGFSSNDVLLFATGEYDGTLVKTDANGNAVDANGTTITSTAQDPVLDVTALGFWRAEMIAYDVTTSSDVFWDPNPNRTYQTNYCPFMVFQKTSTSGTVINLSSNTWCANWGIGLIGTNFHGDLCSTHSIVADSRIRQITERMFNLMMTDQTTHTIDVNNGDNLFQNPTRPSYFDVQSAYANVSYNACSMGAIDFTSKGVYLTDGYKLDHGFTFNFGLSQDLYQNTFDANICTVVQCSNYNNGLRQAETNHNVNTPQTNVMDKINSSGITVFPNPSSGQFTIQLNKSFADPNAVIEVYNTLGNKVYSEKITGETMNIDLGDQAQGLYLVKFNSGKEIISKTIVVE